MVADAGEGKDEGTNQVTAQTARQIGAEVLGSDDWEKMVRSMEDVVHRGNQGFRGNGTAWAYIGRDIDYRMAGKSGTAQVVEIRQGEEYEEEELSEFDRKHAWFIAFAPVDKPTIALAVLVENGGGGSSVAAPVARAVVDAHMRLQRDREASSQSLEVARR
jgi:penicillin-binding protein 2